MRTEFNVREIEFHEVSKRFQLAEGRTLREFVPLLFKGQGFSEPFYALRDISFAIGRGERSLAIAAATALRSVSGVIGFRRKSVAPSLIASTASSMDANAVAIRTRASGTRSLICWRVSRPLGPGIF